jgi:hypothetical protein
MHNEYSALRSNYCFKDHNIPLTEVSNIEKLIGFKNFAMSCVDISTSFQDISLCLGEQIRNNIDLLQSRLISPRHFLWQRLPTGLPLVCIPLQAYGICGQKGYAGIDLEYD